MAGTRITQFPSLPSGSLASEDVLLVVDVSDTFYSPSGTNKASTVGDLANFFNSQDTFIGLGDTPGSLGSAGQSVVVSADGNSLIFSGVTGVGAGGGGATSFIELTDTADSLGSEGQVTVVSGSEIVFSGIGHLVSRSELSSYVTTSQTGDFITSDQTGDFAGARTTFASLDDTPDLIGSPGQVLVVSDAGGTLQFSDTAGEGAVAFTGLNDTPSGLGSETQAVVVSGTGLAFSGIPLNFTDLDDTVGSLGIEGQALVVSGGVLGFSGVSLTATTVVSGTGAFTAFSQLNDTPSVIQESQLVIGGPTGNLVFSGVESFVLTGETGNFADTTTLESFTEGLNVGTDSSSSGRKLHVVGDVEISGTIFQSGSIFEGGGGSSTFTGLSDTPSGLGLAGQSVVVSADGSSLIFSGITGSSGGGGTTIISGETTSNSGILGNDLFTGDGVETGFMMTRAPLNAFSITVAVNGLLQAPGTNYDLISGRSGLAFPEAPSSGVEIDVRHLGGLVGPSGAQGIQGESTGVVGALASDLFTGNGSAVEFNLSNSIGEAKNIIVSVNGLLQSPVTNYTISGSGLTFPEAPSSGLEIEARHLQGIEGPTGASGDSHIKAWVNFIGVTGGDATITDSFNVNSVSRISTGVYTVNFSGHFDDTNYMFTAGGYQNEGGYAVMPVRDATGTTSVSGYQIAIVSGQSRIDSTGQGVYLSFLGS